MSGKQKKCELCNIECSHEYFDGRNGYYCEACHWKTVNDFNSLVDGDAGYTSGCTVSVGLFSLRRLLDILERQDDMFRWVINDDKRQSVLKLK